MKRIKKRLRESQFVYLPYPSFICFNFIDHKFYYKCFKCYKIYPTCHRLSRYFIKTKCLLHSPRYKNITLSKREIKEEYTFIIEMFSESIIIFEREFN